MKRDIPGFHLAAKGDLASQRNMVDEAIRHSEQSDVDPVDCLAWAGFWARVTLVQGDHTDVEKLIYILSRQAKIAQDTGEHAIERQLWTQTIAFLSQLADAGHEEAAKALNELCDVVPTEEIREADDLVERWNKQYKEQSD